jgi:hypothetical protein
VILGLRLSVQVEAYGNREEDSVKSDVFNYSTNNVTETLRVVGFVLGIVYTEIGK